MYLLLLLTAAVTVARPRVFTGSLLFLLFLEELFRGNKCLFQVLLQVSDLQGVRMVEGVSSLTNAYSQGSHNSLWRQQLLLLGTAPTNSGSVQTAAQLHARHP